MKTKLILIVLNGAFVAAAADPPPPVYKQTPAPPAQSAPQAAAPVAAAPVATPAPPPAAPPKLSAAELEKLVTPIALHPDPLIAIILPASVYPLEIVQAARFVKETNNIPKVDDQPWDENVKELAKFPDMIAKMDADLSWTTQLGEAFLSQSKELMDAIQDLRGKAKKAGTLQTTAQQIITVTNVVILQTNVTEVTSVTKEIVQVQPANPQVVYVPSYPPTVYYPPPAYVYNPVAPLVTFGVGMAWGAVLANNCNWGHGDVDIDVDHNYNKNVNRDSTRNVNRDGSAGGRASATGAQKKWQPDQSRLSKSGAPSTAASARNSEARGWGSTGARPSTGSSGARPSTGTGGARPSTGNAAARPSTGSPSANRPTASPSASRPSSSGSAFGGASSGARSSDFSSRGASSRSSGGGGGRSGGGGGRSGGGGGRGGGGRR